MVQAGKATHNILNINHQTAVIFSGATARNFLQERIEEGINGYVQASLSIYDPIHTFDSLHRWLRSLEELINICESELPKDEQEELRSLDLDLSIAVLAPVISRIIVPRFGEDCSNRVVVTVREFQMQRIIFSLTGDQLGFRTLGGLSSFCQAHRRHLLNIIYLVPHYCQGTTKHQDAELMTVWLHIAKLYMVNLTTLYRQLCILHCVKDYQISVEFDGSIRATRQFNFLESFFTEPERLSPNDSIMEEAFKAITPRIRTSINQRVFSIEEFNIGIKIIESYFIHFGYVDPMFDSIKTIACELAKIARDEYFISISQNQLVEMIESSQPSKNGEIMGQLTLETDLFVANVNSFHPLILLNGIYYSNLNLLFRFLYNLKNVSLNKSKTFQINSGFIFERNVKRELLALGYQMLEESKRIEHQEFDVVAIREDVLYNFQCKNNFIDLTFVELSPARFGKKNKSLVASFERALEKERKREHLLINKYRVQTVKHLVISRFPVVTDSADIISFSTLDEQLR